jgi:phage shock protein PspC (stress-responsive transcriptional regulator)
MDKTININIAGTLFRINEDGYKILSNYLQAINNRLGNTVGGNETIDDIECRIAEIFNSQQGNTGVISKENVESMISIIGRPEDFDIIEDDEKQKPSTGIRKRMYRNPDDSVISGVCGGIGAYLNTDPVIFRVTFALVALFFGFGFLVYIILWIALPSANTELRKREMYGNLYHRSKTYNDNDPQNIHSFNKGYYNSSKLGSAINEIFKAVGRIFFFAFRIIMILLGTTLLITGFLAILSSIMILVFNYPAIFSDNGSFISPDFLGYIVDPSSVPWIKALVLAIIIIPMLAIIYGGIKMVFWFKARDGIYLISGLVLWVIVIAILGFLLFNQGINFNESAKSTDQFIFSQKSDTLYLKAMNKISDLKYDNKISFGKNYSVMINNDKKELYFSPCVKILPSDDNVVKVNLNKRSSGRTKTEALDKSKEVTYNYKISGDTLFIDEYFTIPSGRKWSADNVGVNIYLPSGTSLKSDPVTENLINQRYIHDTDNW